MRLVDLCCGAGAITLHALGGRHLLPPTGWMGGKRRQAGAILDALGVDRRRLGEVLMVDSSSWGWVWSVIVGPDGDLVADVLDSWSDEEPIGLWNRFVGTPLPGDGPEAVACWLWVQARSASSVPVWFDGDWYMAEKSITTPRKKPRQKAMGAGRSKGPHSPCVVASRVRAARAAMLGRVQVLHADARRVSVWPGDRVAFDPPYQGCTAYEHALPRAAVVDLAEDLAYAGAVVAVCEAEGLPIDGWHHLDLSHLGRKGAGPEWLTLSHPPVVYQAALPLRRTA